MIIPGSQPDRPGLTPVVTTRFLSVQPLQVLLLVFIDQAAQAS